jgi:RNA polymerase sigma-70 factor (ECF subfamily)
MTDLSLTHGSATPGGATGEATALFHAAAGPGSRGVVSDTSFESLMSDHHGEIYRYLRRMTGRPSDADDLSQETFLRAFRAYRGLPADANRRAWLFTIATNLARNHFRSQKRRRLAYGAAEEMMASTDGTRPDRTTLARETGARIEAVVDRLPLRQRVAFIQRKVHGLEYDAIAQSLRCSTETARAHVFQALRKVRRGLEADGLGARI